jgi:serine transporter
VSQVFSVGFLHYVGPIIAITAIISSFLGTFLGTREALNGLVAKVVARGSDTSKVNMKKVDVATVVIIFVMLWFFAVKNLKVLSILGAMSAPLIAAMLYILPLIVVYRAERFKRFRSKQLLFWYAIGGILIIFGDLIASFLK